MRLKISPAYFSARKNKEKQLAYARNEKEIIVMSCSNASNVLSFSIVTMDSKRKKKETTYSVADVLFKVASDVKNDTGSDSLVLSEAYIRFFSRETGLKFMDVVNQALSCGIAITLDDPIIDIEAGTKKLTSEQEAILIFIIRDKSSSDEMKHWAEDILIQANMDAAYFSLKKAHMSGVSNGTFDMEDLLQEAYEAFLIGIRATSFNPLTGGRLSTYLSTKGAFAITDKMRKDELFDHHGATRYEQVALLDIARAREEGREPDVKEISEHSTLVESKIKDLIARDMCLPTHVSFQDMADEFGCGQLCGNRYISSDSFETDNDSFNPDYDNIMIARDFLEKVEYALSNYLTDNQRKIFLMKNGDEDYSVRRIAEILGLSSYEVKKQYKEAVDRLLMTFKYIYRTDASDYIL